MDFVIDCIVDSEEQDISTLFLQMQRNQIINSREHFDCYCYVLPFFGFNSAKYELNLIETSLLPISANERDIEPTVMKKANLFFPSNSVIFS